MFTSTRKPYILLLLSIIFVPGAIIVYPRYQYFEKLYAVAFLSFSSMVAYFAYRTFFIENITRVEFMEIIYANNAIVNVIAVFCINQFLKPRYKLMYAKIQQQCSNHQFINISNKYCIELLDNYKWLMPSMFVAVNSIPLIVIKYTDTKIGDLEALIFPSWYPWDCKVKWKYLLTVTLQLVCTTLGYVSMTCSIAVLFCYTIAVQTHADIFKKDVEECFEASRELFTVERKFVDIIQRHQHLMRFTQEVNDLCSCLAVNTIIIFFITFVSLISMYVQVPDNYLFNLKLISASAISTVFFFWCCCVGEILSTVNLQINQNLYEAVWYTKELEIQKMVLLFITQNGKEFKLKIFNMYWIKLGYFINVIKICYSVIQILSK